MVAGGYEVRENWKSPGMKTSDGFQSLQGKMNILTKGL